MARNDKPGRILEDLTAPAPATGGIAERALAGRAPSDGGNTASELVAYEDTVMQIGGKSYKVKQEVTLPVLKQDTNDVAFTVLDAMYTGREIKAEGKAKMEAATLVKVRDLADSRKKIYVVNAVLKSEWSENPDYAENKYIGKSFAIRKLPKAEGKRHRDLQIVELEGIEPGDTVDVIGSATDNIDTPQAKPQID